MWAKHLTYNGEMMNGETLYGVYRQKLADINVGADEWKHLDDYDHVAWNAATVAVMTEALRNANTMQLVEKKPEHEHNGDYPSEDSYKEGYADGFNDCINQIALLNGIV